MAASYSASRVAMASWKHSVGLPCRPLDVDFSKLPAAVAIVSTRFAPVVGLLAGLALMLISGQLLLATGFSLPARFLPIAALSIAGLCIAILCAERLSRCERYVFGPCGVAIYSRRWFKGRWWQSRYREFTALELREQRASGATWKKPYQIVEPRHAEDGRSVPVHIGRCKEVAQAKRRAIAQHLGLATPAGQSMDASERKTASSGSPEAPGTQWSFPSHPPEGITIENLRKRGFDLLRLHVRGRNTSKRLIAFSVMAATLALAAGAFAHQRHLGGALAVGLLAVGLALARRTAAGSWTITIVPDRLTIGFDRTGGSHSADTVLMFSEIQEVRIRKSAVRSQDAVVVATSTATVAVGAGLSSEALEWLKNYLIMEVSGLTWRPIFDVGRQTTRKRSAGQTNILQNRPELARKIRAVFLEQAPHRFEKLRAAVEKKDAVGIKREAHWLKSS